MPKLKSDLKPRAKADKTIMVATKLNHEEMRHLLAKSLKFKCKKAAYVRLCINNYVPTAKDFE